MVARFAVNREAQGRGKGEEFLWDAMCRAFATNTLAPLEVVAPEMLLLQVGLELLLDLRQLAFT